MRDLQGNLRIDRLLLFLILIVLTIGTIIDTVGNQRLEDTVHQTDVIAQCLNPDSECSKLTSERDKREREYLEKLMKVTNICVVHATRTAVGQDIGVVIAAYDECVRLGTPPPPVPIGQMDD